MCIFYSFVLVDLFFSIWFKLFALLPCKVFVNSKSNNIGLELGLDF